MIIVLTIVIQKLLIILRLGIIDISNIKHIRKIDEELLPVV